MNHVVTYPRIDHKRGLAVRVERHPGQKICAHISLRHTAERIFDHRLDAAALVTPLRGFLLDAHITACLTACLTVIHDRLLGLPPVEIHRAMVTARRILEGGGTVYAAVHWAMKPYDDNFDLRA